jgi:PKD repeat protein
MNIWVTDISTAGVLGYSYLPWSGNALTCTYGCVIEQTSSGGFGSGRHVLSHEMGHALGLYHTFHGVDEVTPCSDCSENPGDAGADNEGDFCADTRPTPTNYNCYDVSTTSPCNSLPWAPTDYLNYMGYASTTCQTHFSAQQMARMRCWTQSALSPLILGVRVLADVTFGPAPLTVNFTGTASSIPTSWQWTFGDGGTATVQNPTHTYGPGYFDVQATIQTASSGSYSTKAPGFISAYADTLKATLVGARVVQPVKVDILSHNYLPLTGVTIPITWAGTYNVVLDSVRNVGTRTEGWSFQLVQVDDGNKRRTYGFDFTTGGPQTTLPAGNGAILSLWFRVTSNAPVGSVLPVAIVPYAYQTPQMTASAGVYTPATVGGSIVMCRRGDVNNDGWGPDIDDLTELIAYLYLGGAVPQITAQADCDGITGIDIGDLTAMIDYMYLGGPTLTCGT